MGPAYDGRVDPTPLRLAIVDDYEIVVAGVARMLEPFSDRVEVVQLAPDRPVTVDVDVALYDSFAQSEADGLDLDVLLANPRARRVVIYTWAFSPRLIEVALNKGVHGYLSKTVPAETLVEALEAVNADEIVVRPSESFHRPTTPLTWPGYTVGLSEREAEILAFITQGKTNSEIAALTYLSQNTIKGYIRTAYRKIGVTTRSQAVLWGVRNGLAREHQRIETWRHMP